MQKLYRVHRTSVGTPWRWTNLGAFKPRLTEEGSTPKVVKKRIKVDTTANMDMQGSGGRWSIQIISNGEFQGSFSADGNFHGVTSGSRSVTAQKIFSTSEPGRWKIKGTGSCTGSSGGGSSGGGQAGVTVLGTDCISYDEGWPVPSWDYHRRLVDETISWICAIYCQNCGRQVRYDTEDVVPCNTIGCTGWWWSCDGSHTHTHIFSGSGSSGGN